MQPFVDDRITLYLNKAIYTNNSVVGGWAEAVMSWAGAVMIWEGRKHP